MNIDYHLYNVMLDYVDCNMPAYMLYVINADNTILFYTILYVIYDNISLHSITQSLCFL